MTKLMTLATLERKILFDDGEEICCENRILKETIKKLNEKNLRLQMILVVQREMILKLEKEIRK